MANIAITFAERVFVNKPIEGIENAVIGLFKTIRLKENSVNLRRANTSVGGVSFSLIDQNEIITNLLAEYQDYFLNRPVSIRIGNDNQSFDELYQLPGTFITAVSHNSNQYDFQASDILFLLNKSINEISTRLSVNISENSSNIQVMGGDTPTENFSNNGILRIGDEFVQYESKTANTFETLTRGLFGSEISDNDAGTEVLAVTRIQTNPITALLQLMISRSGGTPKSRYDILKHGLAIPQESVDIQSFERIRRESFPTDTIDLLVWDDEEFLKLVEVEILQLTNCRFIQNGDKIGLAILGETAESEHVVTDRQISKYSKTSVKYSDIVNRIKVEYDYQWGSDKYLKVRFFRHEESIERFRESKELVYKFKSVNDDDQVQKMVDGYFFRFALPNPQITISTNFEPFQILTGDNVLLDSAIIPSESGELGFHNILEVLKKSVDAIKGKLGFTLAFGSYDRASLSVARISPAAVIEEINTSGPRFVFRVNDATLFRRGHKVRRFFRDITSYGDTTDYYGVSKYDDGSGFPQYDNIFIEPKDTYGSMDYGSGNFGRLHQTDGVVYTIREVDYHENTLIFDEVVHASPGQIFEFADWEDVIQSQKNRYAFVERDYLIG